MLIDVPFCSFFCDHPSYQLLPVCLLGTSMLALFRISFEVAHSGISAMSSFELLCVCNIDNGHSVFEYAHYFSYFCLFCSQLGPRHQTCQSCCIFSIVCLQINWFLHRQDIGGSGERSVHLSCALSFARMHKLSDKNP